MNQANHLCDDTRNLVAATVRASCDQRRLTKAPNDDLLTSLVQLQEASGGFNWGLGFASALGSCSDQKALDAAPFPVEEDSLERQAWLSALAIAIFEDRMCNPALAVGATDKATFTAARSFPTIGVVFQIGRQSRSQD